MRREIFSQKTLFSHRNLLLWKFGASIFQSILSYVSHSLRPSIAENNAKIMLKWCTTTYRQTARKSFLIVCCWFFEWWRKDELWRFYACHKISSFFAAQRNVKVFFLTCRNSFAFWEKVLRCLCFWKVQRILDWNKNAIKKIKVHVKH